MDKLRHHIECFIKTVTKHSNIAKHEKNISVNNLVKEMNVNHFFVYFFFLFYKKDNI